MPAIPSIDYRRLKPGYEALGLVVDFLSRTSPFAGYSAGALAAAVKYQLSNGYHVAAVQGETLVGYAGWLRITRKMGEAWVGGALAELRPVPEAESDATALTTVRCELPPALPGLIRCCRRSEAGRRIFFKRDYGTGEARRGTVFSIG